MPVSETRTLRRTINYAVETALESDETALIRLVYIQPAAFDPDEQRDERATKANTLLDRTATWATEDAGVNEITVETAQLGTDRYVFSPEDVASLIADDAAEHEIGRVILDPGYDPGIGAPLVRPIEVELAKYDGYTVEEAPVSTPVRRTPLLERTSLVQIGAIFLISFGFYQILAGQLYWFDIVTGIVSAAIVAIGLSRVTLSEDPTPASVVRLARMAIYIPYLLVEIIKANIIVAAVILHPRLPIDPRMTQVRPALWGALPITTLANSITLTPGTLTVRVDGRELVVHTLLPAAREDLFDGGLERAVRFVFYGRSAMNLPGLDERNEASILTPAAGETADAQTTESELSPVETDPSDGEIETVAEADADTGTERDKDGDAHRGDDQ